MKTGVDEKRILRRELKNLFLLDYDVGPAYGFMRKYERLGRLTELLRGLRPENMAKDVFEGVIKAIIQQQISLNAAYAITGCLVQKFGEYVEFEGKRYYEFPSPEALAKARIEEMMECKLSRRKAEYIGGFAKAVIEGYNPEALRKKSNEEVISELTGFKGIGIWSAELVLVAVLGRLDAIPADDLAVRRAISRFFFNEKKISAETVRKLAESWERHKGIIAYYLICAEKMKHGV